MPSATLVVSAETDGVVDAGVRIRSTPEGHYCLRPFGTCHAGRCEVEEGGHGVRCADGAEAAARIACALVAVSRHAATCRLHLSADNVPTVSVGNVAQARLTAVLVPLLGELGHVQL